MSRRSKAPAADTATPPMLCSVSGRNSHLSDQGGGDGQEFSARRSAATSPFLAEPHRLFFAILSHAPKLILKLRPLACQLPELFYFFQEEGARIVDHGCLIDDHWSGAVLLRARPLQPVPRIPRPRCAAAL